jgi:hypothetical protein
VKRYLLKQASASNAEALVMCGASHVLPQHESYNEHSVGGTEGHALITNMIERRFGASVKLEDEFPGLTEKIAVIMGGVENPRAEAAYVVNVKTRTSTFLGTNIGREYEKKLGRPLDFYELGVSLDVDGKLDDVAWLRDWKFGTHSSWWQLFIGAMAILWEPSNSTMVEVNAGFVHIESRSEDDEDGERDVVFVSEDSAVIYLQDLDDRADDVVRALDYANELGAKLEAGADPSSVRTVEGVWCKYCGAYPHCPSKWKLVKAMAGLDITNSVAAMSDTDLTAAYLKLGEVEKNIIKKAKGFIKERIEREGAKPIDGTNKVLAPITMPGRASLNRPALAALLREKGVTQEEINGIFKVGEPHTQVRQVNANGPKGKKAS